MRLQQDVEPQEKVSGNPLNPLIMSHSVKELKLLVTTLSHKVSLLVEVKIV